MVDLDYSGKVRPALVMAVDQDYNDDQFDALVINSPYGDEDRAVIAYVEHTLSVRNSQFEVATALPFLQPGAFNCQNIGVVSRTKFIRKRGILSAQLMNSVELSLRKWLALECP